MGVYLNPGKTAYEEAIHSKIFVDKTEMVRYLNSVVKTKQKYVSVSRPRRFGKTLAADMICAYYDRKAESRELFEKLKIAGNVSDNSGLAWDLYLGKFDVIRITMTRFLKEKADVLTALEVMQSLVIRDYKKAYPGAELFDEGDLIQTIDDIYSENDRQVVIVIDEWDAVFRERQDDREGQKEYLDFLRDLMKDNSHVALAYMTGILPIKKYGKHSALNMFDEYSMMTPMQLAPYTGFTGEEVKELCRAYGRDYEKMKAWYDGYEVSDIIPPDPNYAVKETTGKELPAKHYSIYSPLSVVKAVTTGIIQNFWNKTETYEALAEYIRKDFDGLKEAVTLLMSGGRLVVDTGTYQNDMTTFTCRDDVLSLLIHLGYLGYDNEKGEVFIPNKEILDEFKASTKGSEWVSAFKAYEISEELLKATWDMDEEKVAEMVEDAHNQAGNKTYNNEAALSYGIQLAYNSYEEPVHGSSSGL
ncbi:MAG: AAA family ATPase [Lachnospiraceae bacterium]|nr:AAA family ATPase [Lachnospiraceae bacterium]